MMEYTGKIKNIIFKKDDFLIGVFETKDTEFRFKGNMYGVECNDELILKGGWITHPKYGKQLEVIEWERPMPKTKDQAIAFLKSGLIKGVGEKRAIDIVDKLGEQAINIINTDGEKALLGIKGIGKKTAKNIVESVRQTFEVQEIIAQLSAYGITVNLILQLYKNFGTDTVKVIKKNPYELTNLDGVGFIKADEIAKKIGISPTSSYRINACVKFVLNNICNSKGHSFIKEDELVCESLSVLNHNSELEQQVTENELLQSIYNLEDEMLVIENDNVYPKYIYEYEERLAQKLSIMIGSRGGEAMPSLNKHIKQYQLENKIILANKQKEAIQRLFEEQLLVLTGGPGTGKTTVVKAMIKIFLKLNPIADIRLCAPTGRASKKLEEATGYEAMTIHRMLGFKKGEMPEYNSDNKLPADLVIIDEFSMADLKISYALMSALRNDTKVLFIGDVDQLPSVGVGNVLNDLIQSGIPTVQLTEVFRQAEESQIIINAHRINRGKSLLIDKDKNDFYFIRQYDPQKISDFIIKSAVRFVELGYKLEDILILSPMYKGEAGVSVLNERLRESLNPKDDKKRELKIGQRFFREGDKVIQTVNNPEKDVFNGEIGIVEKITTELDVNKEKIDVMYCRFDNKKIKYYRESCKELQLGYSITIHKSQGGEAAIVIMPITTCHHIMLARNLYYTGITRAKEKVVLIGTEQAMNIAINNDQVSKRNSYLDTRIKLKREYINRYKTNKVQHS